MRQGFVCVAGLDEAGRGPWAGPVVAAAVVLRHRVRWQCRIDDSKRLTPRARERSFAEILVKSAVGVGEAGPHVIDRVGIVRATALAMRRAVDGLPQSPDLLLIDGSVPVEGHWPRWYVVRGELASQAIAAASIVAKVTRDRRMDDWDRVYPAYGFCRHRGYGTAEHRLALQQFGPLPIHRRSFAPVRALPCEGEAVHRRRGVDGRAGRD